MPRAPEGSPATQIPQPLQPLTVTQLDDELPPLDPDGGPRLSLRIVDPVPITDVLLGLVRNTGFSLVPDPAIGGMFAGELKNATLREALEHVLPSLTLDYSIDGRFIRVFPVRLDTRIFDVNYVATRRIADRVLDASTGFDSRLPSIQPSTASSRREVSVNEAARPRVASASPNGSQTTVLVRDDADFFDELTAGIATLLSDEGRFNLDRKAGLLQVTDLPDRLDRMRVYLEAAVARVHQQVQLSAQVIEVELDDPTAAGIDWESVLRHAGESVTVTDPRSSLVGHAPLGIQLRDVEGLLQALGSQGRVNVLSSPRMVTMHNEPVVIRVGVQDVAFTPLSETDAMAAPRAVTEGLVLRVTAHVSADGVIVMSVSPSLTERVGETRSRLGDPVPILAVRETDSVVRVPEGDTVLITGLMLDRVRIDESRVPVLGAVPWVGGLFRHEELTRRRTDLVILLTPTTLPPAGPPIATRSEPLLAVPSAEPRLLSAGLV